MITYTHIREVLGSTSLCGIRGLIFEKTYAAITQLEEVEDRSSQGWRQADFSEGGWLAEISEGCTQVKKGRTLSADRRKDVERRKSWKNVGRQFSLKEDGSFI